MSKEATKNSLKVRRVAYAQISNVVKNKLGYILDKRSCKEIYDLVFETTFNEATKYDEVKLPGNLGVITRSYVPQKSRLGYSGGKGSPIVEKLVDHYIYLRVKLGVMFRKSVIADFREKYPDNNFDN